MRRGLLLVAAAALLFAGLPLFADYNRDATVTAMRSNVAGLTKAKASAASGDFLAAADGLMTIAKNAIMLSTMDPPKGDKAVWSDLQAQLAKAAFRGIGACGTEDSKALEAALAEIGAIQKKGHGTFKG